MLDANLIPDKLTHFSDQPLETLSPFDRTTLDQLHTLGIHLASMAVPALTMRDSAAGRGTRRMAVGLDGGMHNDADRRLLLQRQLSIMWSFAEEFVLGEIDEELALWEPSTNVCTVHRRQDGWVADWPDEDNPPLPEVTIAWLLWHIEWWWSDTISRVTDGTPIAPEDHRWSGGTAGIATAKQQWDTLLAATDLDDPVDWLMPDPQPLWFVASWVNVELTKNLTEINQVKMRRANLHS
ncbi:DinB family protein [Ornithinimicrobium sp. LYQ92]|uniref:DinB family protein n=1 Tax=Serinicoccus sp. LYQ92 TaxID=3378798 RepID=UPI0038554922